MKKNFNIALFFLVIFAANVFLWVTQAESGPAKTVVVIDAAHGGADPGVHITDRIQEKDITLKLAVLLQKELARNGSLHVLLTRDGDRDVSLDDRLKIIGDAAPRAVISLHVNAGFGKAAKGFEVYFPGFKTGKADKDGPGAIIRDMKKNKHLNDSVRLAQGIQRQLESVFKKENRGLRYAPLRLLSDLSVPAVVVEIGFAENPDNRKKLTDATHQQEIARALSRGILDSL